MMQKRIGRPTRGFTFDPGRNRPAAAPKANGTPAAKSTPKSASERASPEA